MYGALAKPVKVLASKLHAQLDAERGRSRHPDDHTCPLGLPRYRSSDTQKRDQRKRGGSSAWEPQVPDKTAANQAVEKIISFSVEERNTRATE